MSAVRKSSSYIITTMTSCAFSNVPFPCDPFWVSSPISFASMIVDFILPRVIPLSSLVVYDTDVVLLCFPLTSYAHTYIVLIRCYSA